MLCLKNGIYQLDKGDSMKARIDDRIKDEYEAKIKGKFKIYLGDELYAKGKNKWTRYFMSSIIEFMHSTKSTVLDTVYDGTVTVYAYGLSYGHTARVGTDETTPTTPNMSDLVSKVDIAPNTKSVVIFKESDYSKYSSRHKYTWNPGRIPPQTIGEFGVYLFLTNDAWGSPAVNTTFYYNIADGKNVTLDYPASRLGARISSGDGDFDPINYTSEEALILEWYVTIIFLE